MILYLLGQVETEMEEIRQEARVTRKAEEVGRTGERKMTEKIPQKRSQPSKYVSFLTAIIRFEGFHEEICVLLRTYWLETCCVFTIAKVCLNFSDQNRNLRLIALNNHLK